MNDIAIETHSRTYPVFGNGLKIIDNNVKIVDIERNKLLPNVRQLLLSSNPTYLDPALKEHLFSACDLEDLCGTVQEDQVLQQLQQIIGLIRHHQIAYIRAITF